MRVHFFLFKSEKKTDEGQLKQMRQVPENLFFFFFWPKHCSENTRVSDEENFSPGID